MEAKITVYIKYENTEQGIKGVASRKPPGEELPGNETIEVLGDMALMVMQDLEHRVKQRWGERIHIIQSVVS